jgi:hypothetical protein
MLRDALAGPLGRKGPPYNGGRNARPLRPLKKSLFLL